MTIFKNTSSVVPRSSEGGAFPPTRQLIFRRDVSLSYHLLRYLHSSAFAFSMEIHSIPHALTLLGEKALKKWISLVGFAALGDEVAGGLLKVPLLRAMFCELLGTKIGMFREANELFLMGLLSVMSALLNVRMKEVLSEIPVDDAIKNGLLGLPSRFRPIFDVVLDYESGTWEQLAHSARAIGLHENFPRKQPWRFERQDHFFASARNSAAM